MSFSSMSLRCARERWKLWCQFRTLQPSRKDPRDRMSFHGNLSGPSCRPTIRHMRLASWMIAWCGIVSIAGFAQQSQPEAQKTQSSQASSPSSKQIHSAEKFYAQGVRAMGKGDVEAAEKDFSKAALADPSNGGYAEAWQIARQHAVTKLMQDADKARVMGQADAARAKLAQAL